MLDGACPAEYHPHTMRNRAAVTFCTFMSRSSVFSAVAHCVRTLSLVVDLVRLASLAVHSHSALAAENLFLPKQLPMFRERKAQPRRSDDATRWIMAALSRAFQWA